MTIGAHASLKADCYVLLESCAAAVILQLVINVSEVDVEGNWRSDYEGCNGFLG